MQLLQEAVREFEGTTEEVSIMVADCEASISLGDVAGAVQRLKQVPSSSPHYARACVAMAEIHLKHRKDKAAYIKCYLHLVVSDAVGGGVLPFLQLVPLSLGRCLGFMFDRLPPQCVLV